VEAWVQSAAIPDYLLQSTSIAEGHGRDHLGDYLPHLSVANGSLMELETHLLLLPRLSYLKSSELENALNFLPFSHLEPHT
jgi:hypothetical protein